MKLFFSLFWGVSLGFSGSPEPSRAIRQCATCHPTQSKRHPETSMAHALERVSECKVLKDHPSLAFQNGTYSYRIEKAIRAFTPFRMDSKPLQSPSVGHLVSAQSDKHMYTKRT